jgi:hypothetical protein
VTADALIQVKDHRNLRSEFHVNPPLFPIP